MERKMGARKHGAITLITTAIVHRRSKLDMS
jgi:hypothetical protein